MAKKNLQLGRAVKAPASPDDAVLDAVPNPHMGEDYLVRFTAPEFTTLCPITGQPDFAHSCWTMYPAKVWWNPSPSSSSWAVSAMSAAFTKTVP